MNDITNDTEGVHDMLPCLEEISTADTPLTSRILSPFTTCNIRLSNDDNCRSSRPPLKCT